MTRDSKLVEFDIKADAELFIAPYMAELLRSRPPKPSVCTACVISLATKWDNPIDTLSWTIEEMSFLSSHTCTIGACFLQTRPARAVQFGNTMSGALEDDWVDVGQIDAAATAITGL